MRRAKQSVAGRRLESACRDHAKFRAELTVYSQLRAAGKTHLDAMRALYGADGSDSE